MDHQRRGVLVAGGAGFLGSHLCDKLHARHLHVVCLDSLRTGSIENISHLLGRPHFSFIEADLTEPLPKSLERRRDIGQIFNLASAASPPHYQADPEHTLLTNVVGTQRLLRLAETWAARFVLASTSEVYGDPDVHPQRESYHGSVNPVGPRACYDEGKRAAETLASDYRRLSRCDARIARIFNTYGPRMRADDGRVVSNLVVQALSGDALTLYGDGLQTRSFCFVSDLIEGLIRLMGIKAPCEVPMNLGNPHEITMRDLAIKITDLAESESQIVYCDLPIDDPRRRQPDITRAQTCLGWSPRISLDEGLRLTIAYFARIAQQNRPTLLQPLQSRWAP